MLGEANAGKTPAAVIIAMMFSRYYVGKFGLNRDASYRVAPDIDFFRGNPGTVGQPYIFDDGDIDKAEVAKIKAFMDVSEEEAMTRERWGASKFVRGQLRIAIDNKYDPRGEPDGEMLGTSENVEMNYIYDMIRPAFPKVGTPDLEAILKRSCLIINSKKYFYVKLAAQPTATRYAMPINEMGLPSFLTQEASDLWQRFTQDATAMPPASELRDLIDTEQFLLRRLLDSVPAPPRWVRQVFEAP
jgi:hypothetical protein